MELLDAALVKCSRESYYDLLVFDEIAEKPIWEQEFKKYLEVLYGMWVKQI